MNNQAKELLLDLLMLKVRYSDRDFEQVAKAVKKKDEFIADILKWMKELDAIEEPPAPARSRPKSGRRKRKRESAEAADVATIATIQEVEPVGVVLEPAEQDVEVFEQEAELTNPIEELAKQDVKPAKPEEEPAKQEAVATKDELVQACLELLQSKATFKTVKDLRSYLSAKLDISGKKSSKKELKEKFAAYLSELTIEEIQKEIDLLHDRVQLEDETSSFINMANAIVDSRMEKRY